jgi:hypothetical protein
VAIKLPVQNTSNNFDMSDYDRFANWVEKQRRCPKDALETTINQIDIKFVRSIMKGIDRSKGTPAAAKKTDTERAKAMRHDAINLA